MKKYLFLVALISCSDPEVKEPLNTAILGSWTTVSDSKVCPSGNTSETFDCQVSCTQYLITGSEFTITTVLNGSGWSQKVVTYQIGGDKVYMATGEVYTVTLNGNNMTWTFDEYDCRVTRNLKR